MNYSVSQILYLLMHKEKTVIPVQVVEKVLRTTVEGEVVSYVIELPTKNRDKRGLDTIEASVYENSDNVRAAMLQNANKTINTIIEKSKKIAERFSPPADSEETPGEKDLTGKIDVDLGDGTIGKISIDSINEGGESGNHSI